MDSYDTGSGWAIGLPLREYQVAVSFVAGFTGTLDSIRVGVVHVADPNSYILTLASDSSGAPGADLETFNSLVFADPSGIITANSDGNPAMSAGSNYWVVMRATDPAASWGIWNVNDQGILGFSGRNITKGNIWVARNELSPAVEVNAKASESAIPEPSTLALTIAGGLAVLLVRRRRASRAD